MMPPVSNLTGERYFHWQRSRKEGLRLDLTMEPSGCGIQLKALALRAINVMLISSVYWLYSLMVDWLSDLLCRA